MLFFFFEIRYFVFFSFLPSTECEAIKSPRPVKPAFIESLRSSNELLRASARAEPRAAAFKVIFELPSLVLSFDAGGFFPPFCEAEVQPIFAPHSCPVPP